MIVTLLKYRKCLRGFTLTVLPQTQRITSAIILVGLRFRQTRTVTSLHLNKEFNCQLPFSFNLKSCILVSINNFKFSKV